MRPTFARIAHERALTSAEARMTAEFARRYKERRTEPGFDAVERWAALGAIASGIEKTYSGIERTLTIIAAQIDDDVPRDPEWHRSLLNQMILPLQGVRPAVLSSETARLFDQLRGFRHRKRNMYGFEVNEERLLPLVEAATWAVAAFDRDVAEFQQTMGQP